MKKVLVVWFVLLAVTLSCGGVHAAQFNDEAELAQNVIQAERRLAIFRVMDLSESQKTVFWPVYDEYIADMAKINDRMLTLIRDCAVNYQNVSDEKALAILNEMFSIEKNKLALAETYMKKFEQILPGVKVARFFQAEDKLDAQRDMNLTAQIPLLGGKKTQQ